MIKDHEKILTKENIELFSSKGEAIKSITNMEDFFMIEYYFDDEIVSESTYEYSVKEIYSKLDEIGLFRESKYDYDLQILPEDTNRIRVFDDYFHKIDFLEKLLFDKDYVTKKLSLGKYAKILESNDITIDAIVQELEIIEEDIIFNDIEILLYAYSTSYDKWLEKIEKMTKGMNIVTERSIHYVRYSDNILYDQNDSLLIRFTLIEGKIFTLLKSFSKEGGVSITNIQNSTKQASPISVKQSIKVLNKKIKNKGLDDYIFFVKKHGTAQYVLLYKSREKVESR